jgi:hypothetical protein
MGDDYWDEPEPDPGRTDPRQEEAAAALIAFFEANREWVFFSRQLEVIHEGQWFHWITNRALRALATKEIIKVDVRRLATGGSVNLMWHRSYRYHQRQAAQVVQLLESYSDPNIGAALGLHGESMVLEGFARRQFVMTGRNTNVFGDTTWTETEHDLDFIFEKDNVA